MPAKQKSPFIYGPPVRFEEFLDREDDLHHVLDRLRKGLSTAIVGEPHIGKSSLLLRLEDISVHTNYLDDESSVWVISRIDMSSIGSNLAYDEKAFWNEVLEPLREYVTNTAAAQLFEIASHNNYERQSLLRLIKNLAKQNISLILLLDEFEILLEHKNFRSDSFLGLLRSLTSEGRGFLVVFASRFSIKEMHDKVQDLQNASPFFNTLSNRSLRPFNNEAIDILLDQARKAGNAFSINDKLFIRRLAGRNPYLLQAMADELFNCKGEKQQLVAANNFYKHISFHFDDIWGRLDEKCRTTAVILAMIDFRGRVLGQEFAYGEIERISQFEPELKMLEELGLVEKIGEEWEFDWKHLLLWQGEKWAIDSQAFVWWIRDNPVREARQMPTYEQWLQKKRYKFLLTQEQWDWTKKMAQSAPQWAIQGVSGLAKLLLNEIIEAVKGKNSEAT